MMNSSVKIFNTVFATIVDNLEGLISCLLMFLGFDLQMTSDSIIRENSKSCCLLVSFRGLMKRSSGWLAKF